MVQDLMTAYSPSNPFFIRLIIVSILTFGMGYIEYIYSFRLVIKEKSAPYPIWMHTFYFAHDFSGAIVFLTLAKKTGFWFFWVAGIALIIWNFFEVYNIYKAVTVEREDIWGKDSTVKQAMKEVIFQIAIMFCVVNLFRVFMNDEVMFKWFAFTNILIAVAPGYYWQSRKTRKGASLGLSITIMIGTFLTFLPPGFGMWTTASPYFDQPWFYITGLVTMLFAIRNYFILKAFPEKEKIEGQKTIW